MADATLSTAMDKFLRGVALSGAEQTTLVTALGLETGATADQSNAEILAAYEAGRSLISQAEAEAGTATTVRLFNALRVKQAIDAGIASLIDSAPGALDTLNELAASLGDDADFAGTMTTALAGKQPLDALLTSIAALVFSGNGSKFLAVNSGATDFEFVDAPSGGSGLSVTETLTPSGASSSYTSAFTSGKIIQMFYLKNILCSLDGYELQARVGTSDTFDSGASDYGWGSDQIGSYAVGSGDGTSYMKVGSLVGKDAGEELHGLLFLLNALDSGSHTQLCGLTWKTANFNTTTPIGWVQFGFRNADQEDTQIEFSFSGGNISGTIYYIDLV